MWPILRGALRELGAELISTGGTAKLLREAGIAVRDVSEVTGFPEMLDGRVKTMHPKIAGGILAIRANPAHMQALPSTESSRSIWSWSTSTSSKRSPPSADARLEDLIENIDIGGPTMIRSAAKNYQDVAVVTVAGRLSGDARGAARERRRVVARDAVAPGAKGISHDGGL